MMPVFIPTKVEPVEQAGGKPKKGSKKATKKGSKKVTKQTTKKRNTLYMYVFYVNKDKLKVPNVLVPYTLHTLYTGFYFIPFV